jgi:hypothetical protein
VDHYHRLFYALRWLSTGESFREEEFQYQYSKTSLNDDLRHVLHCVIEGLDNCVVWPDANERAKIAKETTGIMENCVGVLDCTEHVVSRSNMDAKKSQDRFSGKLNKPSLKTISVINRAGYFRFVQTGFDGHRNDRDIFTSSALYLQRGKFFSTGELLASDGGFIGDGPVFYSHNRTNNDIDKEMYNIAFGHYRQTIETAYGRIQRWFPILGIRKKYWNYNDDLLTLAVYASVRLHNWLLRIRKLDYSINTDQQYLFHNLF